MTFFKQIFLKTYSTEHFPSHIFIKVADNDAHIFLLQMI